MHYSFENNCIFCVLGQILIPFFSSYKKYLLIQIMLFPNNNKKSINVVNVFPKIHGATVLKDQIMKFHKIYIVQFINFLKIKNIKCDWLLILGLLLACLNAFSQINPPLHAYVLLPMPNAPLWIVWCMH